MLETHPGAEVATIAATRAFYDTLAVALTADVTQIELALANLAGLDLDEDTLSNFQSAQADAQRAAHRCRTTVAVLDTMHGGVEQAVQATPDAARIDFYQESGSMPVRPGPTPATSEPGGESDARDQLARGIYLAPYPQRWDWQRRQARLWDAGQVEPEKIAAAYAHADAIIAERAAGASADAGAGADRQERMREHGITRCPSWCSQDDDEHDYEEHVGPGKTFTTETGDAIVVRPRVSWWSDTSPTVEILITPGENGTAGTLVLDADEVALLTEISGEVMADAEQQREQAYGPVDAGKPAYPGAEFDAANADHQPLEPAAAVAAIEAEDRSSAFYLGDEEDEEDEHGPYLDWSSRHDAGLRTFEVGDGQDTVSLDLSPAGISQLRDDLDRALGQHEAGEPDPGAWYSPEDSEVYIDWSTVEKDGRHYVEFADGIDSAQVEMTAEQFREWRDRLALRIELDNQPQ